MRWLVAMARRKRVMARGRKGQRRAGAKGYAEQRTHAPRPFPSLHAVLPDEVKARLARTVGRVREIGGEMPPVLYHYTGARGIVGILESRCLWASSATHLNDTRELRQAEEVARDVAQGLGSGDIDTPWTDHLRELVDHADKITEWSPPRFVASLSARDDSVEQWRAYGSRYAGFAIGFASRGLRDLLRAHGGYLVPCIYRASDQRALVKGIIEAHRGEVEAADPNALVSTLVDLALFAPFVKHMSFQQEEEWRVVKHAGREGEVLLRDAEAGLVPYLKIDLGRRARQLPIERIVVGPSPRLAENREALRLYLDNRQLPAVRVDVSKVPYRGW